MHLVEETFHTLLLRRWEAGHLCAELSRLLDDAEIALEDYPALDTLFGALSLVADEQAGIPIVTEEATPAIEAPTTADTEEE